VEKAVELLPLGPVLFLDTAGLDDTSTLSSLRIQKTEKVYDRADVILLVTEPEIWTDYEEAVLTEAGKRKIPTLIVINKIDLTPPSEGFIQKLKDRSSRIIPLSSVDWKGRDISVELLKRHIIEAAPDDFIQTPSLIGDLLPPGGLALLVVPIDLQAPKGRLILPQVQTIRDALDCDAAVLIVKERELFPALATLNRAPSIVVCDSQAILKVSADVPNSVPCTTFSILFARQKGDIVSAAAGVTRIDELVPGDRILIAEACSHHPLQDDIGRVKIPRWLRQYVGAEIQVDVSAGRDYPDNLKDYNLIIHCGACMLTRREMLNRIQKAKEAGVPITNYGIAISFLQGVIRRTLSPFPSALYAYEKKTEVIKEHKRSVRETIHENSGK
jgi:[FeFe] hydrogenase H-cluster maturation GTPase HydF